MGGGGISAVKAAARSNVRRLVPGAPASNPVAPKLSADAILPAGSASSISGRRRRLLSWTSLCSAIQHRLTILRRVEICDASDSVNGLTALA